MILKKVKVYNDETSEIDDDKIDKLVVLSKTVIFIIFGSCIIYRNIIWFLLTKI